MDIYGDCDMRSHKTANKVLAGITVVLYLLVLLSVFAGWLVVALVGAVGLIIILPLGLAHAYWIERRETAGKNAQN